MGVDVVIYVHKSDLEKMLGIKDKFPRWQDFLFLVDYTVTRWHTFEREFDLENIGKDIYEEGITSKELLLHMAKINKSIPNRTVWARILNEYNLLFAPYTKTDIGDEWIDIDWLYTAIKRLVIRRFDELMKIYEEVKNE